MTNTEKIATGVLVGAAVGATLGILFAPDKGSKTRAKIVDKSKEMGSSVGKGFDKAKDLLNLKKQKEDEMAMN